MDIMDQFRKDCIAEYCNEDNDDDNDDEDDDNYSKERIAKLHPEFYQDLVETGVFND
jgi:hypothetical protein